MGSLPKQRAARAASWRTRHERRVVELLTERETLMNEIALRARINALPPMLAKARTLLTRFWAKADWQARSELLPVAHMLLVLGAAQSGLRRSATASPPKRRTATGEKKTGASRRGSGAPTSRSSPRLTA